MSKSQPKAKRVVTTVIIPVATTVLPEELRLCTSYYCSLIICSCSTMQHRRDNIVRAVASNDMD